MLENRPILAATLGYIIGIILGLYCKISIVLFYFILYLIYLGFKGKKTKNKFKLFSFKRYFRYIKIIFNKKVVKIVIIFSVISNTVVFVQNNRYENLYKGLDGNNIQIQGIIVEKIGDKYKVKVSDKAYKNTNLYVSLKEDSKSNGLEYGDEVKLQGKFVEPRKRSNYKGFDYFNYLKTLKIYGTIKVNKLEVISKENGNFILKYTNQLSTKMKEKIENSNLSNDAKSILKGLLIGDKSNISENIIDDFSESNISHILAISGLHVSYIIMFASAILNKSIGKHFSKPLASIVILIYMCIVNFTPSVIRAGVTGIVTIMSTFFYRKKDTFEALSLSLFIILVYNPFLVQNIGLQLSFAGTIGIIVFIPKINKWIKSYLERIEARAIRKNKRFQKKLIKLMKAKIILKVQNAIIITVSATMIVMPIVLENFNKVSVTSLVVSVITSFIIGPIVILGLIFLVIKINLIEQSLSFLLKTLIVIAKWGSSLPFNQIYLVTPSILQIVIYYVFLFTFFFIINIKFEKNLSGFQKRIKNLVNFVKYEFKINKRRCVSGILSICLMASCVVVIPKNLKIYFVDVGQRRLHAYYNTEASVNFN